MNYSSPVVVEGAPVTVAVAFSNLTYTATVLESGLPAGSSWTATATGVTTGAPWSGGSTGTSITLRLPYGTYDLSASGPPGYRVSLAETEFSLHGSGTTLLAVVFTAPAPTSVTSPALPWFTTGVLLITAVVGLCGAAWGYRQYQLRQWRSEADRWVEELNRDGEEPVKVPPR